MLEVGLVVGAGGEQDDQRRLVVGRRPVRQAVAQRGEEVRQVMHAQVAEQLGEHARDDQAVFQRVARPGRRLGAVRDHPPASVRRARQVGGVQVQMHAARRRDAVRRAQEPGMPMHQRRGQQPLAHQPLLAVDVRQDAVEQGGALDHRGLDLGPLRVRDDQRQQVELPGPVGAAGIGIDVVGDAVLADLLLDLGQPLAHLLRRGGHQRVEQRPPVLPRLVRRGEHLVVARRVLGIGGEQLAGHVGQRANRSASRDRTSSRRAGWHSPVTDRDNRLRRGAGRG